MAWRATSLNAMFCVLKRGADAITSAWRTRSGKSIVHCSACIPPKLPPTTAAHCAMPKRSASSAWLFTQSDTVTIGKSAPYCRPVSGLVLKGPVLPAQPPKLFSATTKNLSVSMGLPAPIMLSHQPGYLSSALCRPAAWCVPESAWQIKTALDLSAFSSP